ncbi:MAG: ABC transporter ATP-binding protein [Devosia sp.]
MAGVTLEGLTVRFGDVTAVDRVSLDVEEGEFIVLLGPSGCGKTTTLRCIAGLETASEGRILFDGQPVERLSPKQRNVAMVFQFVSLYPHLSVAENIAFPLRARGERGPGVRQKVNEIAKTFDLTDALSRRPSALPPGAWQKAALARAVVREPKVLLLDEPLSAIDERFREEMRWELRHIQKELGTTTFHVTHDQREAMSLADRVVLMRDGEVVQEGTPAALYDRPVDLFAAQFIGSPSMNLMQGAVDGGTLTVAGQPISVPEDTAHKVAQAVASKDVTVGIRPQDVTLADHADKPAIEAEIVAVSSSGRERQMDFRVGESVHKGFAPPGKANVGARTRMALPPDKLLFFGPDGRRVEV